MSEKQIDYARLWIALFEKAARSLKQERFNQWLLGVETSGTYKERYRVGKAILELLAPSQPTASVIVRGLQNINAISPDAGGAPNPRGVR